VNDTIDFKNCITQKFSRELTFTLLPKFICNYKFSNMKNNAELQKDVQDTLKCEPLLHAAEIGVTVKDGAVALTGTVDSYLKKQQAETAAKNVAGVKAVVEKIEIKLAKWGKTTDSEIAAAILKAFKWNWQVPNDTIKVKVEDGWVTLEGQLHWHYQREAAKDAVQNLVGVTGISNKIKIQSDMHNAVEKLDIESALRRSWSINDDDIDVEVSGTKVTLSGTVKSWYQRDEAEKIAWKAPGVWNVDNELVVEYDYKLVN
jgi:osmotically-inducible protein OsmY